MKTIKASFFLFCLIFTARTALAAKPAVSSKSHTHLSSSQTEAARQTSGETSPEVWRASGEARPEVAACREDTDKFCGATDSGTTPVGQCLQQHTVELSTACREAVTPAKPAWQAELEKTQNTWMACQEDVDKFCEGVQVGEGRLENCLKAHQAKLSKKCKAARGFH